MKNKRRALWMGLGLWLTTSLLPAWAVDTTKLKEELNGNTRLRVAVYNNFAPYSAANKGIDVELGRLLAARLGMEAEIVGFNADEDMNDDLRNMVWKGHYLGTRPADVMLHVPVDAHLAAQNDKVKIFGAYHVEHLAFARNIQKVPVIAGSAAKGLEVFTREKIGVETASLPDSFLLSTLSGRLRENVVHFKTVQEAVQALHEGKVAAVMATRAELESSVRMGEHWVIEPSQLAELKVSYWPVGMAVKAENNALAQALTEALHSVVEDGSLAKLFKTHGVTYSAPGG